MVGKLVAGVINTEELALVRYVGQTPKTKTHE